MIGAPWFEQRFAALDFESSGKDPHEAFIVTACLAFVGGDQPSSPPHEWMLSPGDREIPAEAVAIHKVSTEVAKAKGRDHRDGVDDIAAAIVYALNEGMVLVGHNVGGYDLTLIEAECVRDGVPTVTERLGRPIGPVIDTMTLDRHVAPFRKGVEGAPGPYTLQTMCETYGLAWDQQRAHGSTYDALMSARAAWLMGSIAHRPHRQRPEWARGLRTQRFGDLADVTAQELHELQIRWAAEDAASYQDWLRHKAPPEKRDPDAVIDGSWPLKQRP